MKTILALLLAVTVVNAGEPSIAFQNLKKNMATVKSEAGPGPCPMVTSEQLPDYIQDAMRAKMKDPDSMSIIGWTAPEIRSTPYAGKRLTWWQMNIKIRAKNSYGGFTVENYSVTIEQERVTGISLKLL